MLKPTHFAVTVKNAPVLDVKFTQFRATVSGTVKCIGMVHISFYALGNWAFYFFIVRQSLE